MRETSGGWPDPVSLLTGLGHMGDACVRPLNWCTYEVWLALPVNFP